MPAYQVIEIHSRKPALRPRRWWNVLVAGGNHEPLMSSETFTSEEAAKDNAILVADGRAQIAILHVNHG